MKYQDGRNDQHTSDLELKNLPKFNKERVRKNRVCKFFLKKLQIAIKIRNKCPIGINVH